MLTEAIETLKKLYTEMSSLNVRSFGLKPRIHEDWMRRVQTATRQIEEYMKEDLVHSESNPDEDEE